MRTIAIWLSVLGLFILTGCGETSESAKELIDYHNEHWISVQEIKVDGLSVLNNQIYSQNEVENDKFDVEEALFTMEQVMDYLREIDPEHDEIRKLHDLLVEAEGSALVTLEDQVAFMNGEAEEAQIEGCNEAVVSAFNAFVGYRDELMDIYGAAWGDETDIPGVWEMVE